MFRPDSGQVSSLRVLLTAVLIVELGRTGSTVQWRQRCNKGVVETGRGVSTNGRIAASVSASGRGDCRAGRAGVGSLQPVGQVCGDCGGSAVLHAGIIRLGKL